MNGISRRIATLPLAFKLTLVAMLAVVVAVSVSAWLSFHKSREMLLETSEGLMESAVSRQMERINQGLEQVRRDAEQLGRDSSVHALLRAQYNQGFDRRTSSSWNDLSMLLEGGFSVLLKSRGYQRIRLVNLEDGRELVSVGQASGHNRTGDEQGWGSGQNLEYLAHGSQLAPGQIYVSEITSGRIKRDRGATSALTQYIVAPVFLSSDGTSHREEVKKKAIELAGRIRFYNEVISTSAVWAITSGEKKWELGYWKYHPMLSNAIEEGMTLIGELSRSFITQLDNTGSALDALEQQAFKLMREKQGAQALQLLEGKTYSETRAAYDALIVRFLGELTRFREAAAVVVINTDAGLLLEKLDSGGPYQLFLTNSAGQLLYRSESESHSGRSEFDLKKSYPEAWEELSRHARKVIRGDKGVLLATGAISLGESADDHFLGLVVTSNEADILGDAYDLRFKVAVIALAAIIITGLLGSFLVSRLTRPIRLLTQQADKLTVGERDVALSVSGSDEVSRLGRAFANLVEKLQQQTEEANQQAMEVCYLNESLEERVRERTQELLRAKEAAEAAAKLKSEFLTSINHEIRTPMHVMLGMSQLLVETKLDEEQSDYVESIHNSGNSLLTILNDILDFSKLEAGKLKLERISFDLEQAVYDVVQLLMGSVEEKGLEMIVDYPAETPRQLEGDAGRMRQILLHLLGNAVKFTQKGHVLLRIEVTEQSDSQAKLRIQIQDTGIGIAQEDRERLFQSFTQADGSTTRRYGGTGLGLSISQQLVELMGGEIGVESEIGNGATFWISLTLPVVSTPTSLPQVELAGVRALVVDDYASNRRVLKAQLKSFSMVVEGVSGVEHAKEMMRRAAMAGAPFQLVLLDQHATGEGGEQLAREISADPQLSGTPLILLVTGGQRGDAQRFKELGCFAYLTKPVPPGTLYKSMAGAFALSRENGTDRPLITSHSLAEERDEDNLHQTRGRFSGRALVADDNAVNLKVARSSLEKLGLTVVTAIDGSEAVGFLEHGGFELVFMDCLMPIMDGYQATRTIREQERETGAHIPIVALTANSSEEDRRLCSEAGMDDFLAKPYKLESMVAVLRNWLVEMGSEAEVPHDAGVTQLHVETQQDESIEQGASPAIEMAKLDQLRSAMGSDFAGLIPAYLESTTAMLEEMAQAHEEMDMSVLERLAHSIKSSSASMGAMQLSAVALELEKQAREGRPSMIPEKLLKMSDQFASVHAELERVQQGCAA